MEKIPEIIHESWHKHLQPLFDNPKMLNIKTKLLPKCKWYPGPDNIFRVFRMPINEIKVVILGQDPYHNGTAIGYAFAVNKETPIPGSLRVIKEEIIASKVEIEGDIEKASWRYLVGWRNQGVFLMNTAFTVPIGDAGAHVGQWQWFTKAVVQIISEQENKPIWMLWGDRAQGFEGYILGGKSYSPESNNMFTTKGNVVLKAPHPAAQIYPNADKKYYFVGTNQFKLCNEVLKAKGKNPINW